MLTKIVTCVLSSALIIAWADAADAKAKRKPTSEDRPPQFVLLAFDGSFSNDFWDESLAYADTTVTRDENNESTKKVRFTYFINPPYYTHPSKKSAYVTPGLSDEKPRHASCIGWGKSDSETEKQAYGSIVRRVDYTNQAFLKGHEIGSHANAHCDQTGADSADPMYGHPWSKAHWDSEFDQFNNLLFNVYNINGISPSQASSKYPGGLAFSKRDIVGFRAPKLAVTKGLWPTLSKYGFRYDTSKSSEPTYWPQKQTWGEGSGWNFPLGEIKIADTKRRTFSMDFNWLCFHSGCATKKGLTEEERLRFKNQMLKSYKYYFKINYFGGRGPVHIGHHFSKWNKGAYWDAMKEFTNFVCNKPEVRCVTYKEYADWLDGLGTQQYENYRSGKFTKLRDDGTIKDIATPVLADVRLDMGNNAYEAVISEADRAKAPSMGWKPQLRVNFEPQATTKMTKEELIQKVGLGSSVLVRASLVNRAGQEINWTTHRINKLGTAEETITEPLENRAMQGETEEAHIEGE